MIDDYFIIALVLGTVLSYLGIIHHFWVRHVFTSRRKQLNSH